MKKLYFYIATIIVSTLTLASCSKTFYQVLTTKSDNLTTQTDQLVYEDENCRIIYCLWAPHGNAGFEFHNKTDKKIIVNLKESYFILNDYVHNYYLNRTFIYGRATRLGASKSVSKSAELSKTDYSTLYINDTSATVSGGAGVNASASIEDEANSSVEIKEQALICIPSKTSKVFYEYTVMKNIYRECGFLLAPKKSDTKHLEYTPTNTPIKFSNIICYSIEGNTSSPINVKNNFYVTTIINLPKKEFASKIRVEKDCMGKSLPWSTYKTVYKDKAPNRFYIQYHAIHSDIY